MSIYISGALFLCLLGLLPFLLLFQKKNKIRGENEDRYTVSVPACVLCARTHAHDKSYQLIILAFPLIK